MNTQKYVAVLIIGISLLWSGLSFLIPTATSVEDPFLAHVRTAIAVLVAGLFIGAAVWFFDGMRGFKNRLRLAYGLLGAGLIVFGLASLQLPVAGLYNLWESPWLTEGGAAFVFVAASVLVYFSMRQFTAILRVKSHVRSFFFVTALSIVVAVLCGLAATQWVQYEEAGVDIYIAVLSLIVSYLAFAVYLSQKAIRAIGGRYQQAIKWQSIALLGFALGATHELIGTFFLSGDAFYVQSGLYLWPLVIVGILLVRASYEFRMLTAQERAIVRGEISQPTDQDYIDGLISVVQLISRPADIDPILDKFRAVTAALAEHKALTDKDKKKLLDVYQALEAYLMKDDPLRTFTREEVREHVGTNFSSVLEGRNTSAA